jgi:glycosyltransferase involved in cell wall biosynthesis
MKKRRNEPAVFDAVGILGPVAQAKWMLSRLSAKFSRLSNTPQGVFDFDNEGVFPAETIIEHARSIHQKWDALIVHWSGGYLSPDSVAQIAQALGTKVGLWQVDMAHMTGGCHYSLECDRYQTGCGQCPALQSIVEDDVTRRQSEERRKTWAKLDAIVLAQSTWSARKASVSHVLGGLRQEILPIPLRLSAAPTSGDRVAARQKLGLPEDGRRMALVRTTDPSITYKGFTVLKRAFDVLDSEGVRLHVIGVGSRGLFSEAHRHITYSDLGQLNGDQAMAMAYHAADFFICPSIDDAGPMMVPEAMAAGRPVVSSPVGIANDLIVEGVNGLLCERPGDAKNLASCIRKYAELSDQEIYDQGLAASAIREKLTSAAFAKGFRGAFI